MARSDRVAEILAAIEHPADEHDDTRMADRLVLAGREALPVTGVGLSWMTDQGPGAMVAATDEPARLMEELQFTLGEGPCVESSSTGRPVLQADLRRAAMARWPAFRAGALEAGIAAVFAFPLQVGGIRVGVLDLYRDVPGPLQPDAVREALAFAAAGTTVLLHLQAVAHYGDVHPDLADPFLDRAEVHQASGMIAVQAAVSMADALTMLRARAFAAERPIVEIAHDVVTRVLRFDPRDGDGD